MISHALATRAHWPCVCNNCECEIPNTFATHKLTIFGGKIMKRLLSIVALVGLSGLGINLAAQTPSPTPSQTPSATASQAEPSTPSARPHRSMPPSQTPSAPDSQAAPSTPSASPNSSMPQSQTDATNSQQSARAFEGKIQKSGDELVLQETANQTAYKLDNQDKAKQFEGKNVKVMATMDATPNKLLVDDISPSESKY